MRRSFSTVILIWSALLVGLTSISDAIDHKRAIQEQYKGKVVYISYLPGLYGIFASAAYEHTYRVRSDGTVEFDKVWEWQLKPDELLLRGTKVEIRSAKVKDDRIEMTIRSLEPVSLGVRGFILGGVGAVSNQAAELEVNLRFDIGKDTMKAGDMPTIQKFVSTLISEERPEVNIQVGMKVEEVTAQLGEPEQQIQVENKRLLVYAHLTVIVENGEVIEVKVK